MIADGPTRGYRLGAVVSYFVFPPRVASLFRRSRYASFGRPIISAAGLTGPPQAQLHILGRRVRVKPVGRDFPEPQMRI